MSSNSSKFQKVTFEVRSIPLAHCGIEEIACWCDLLAIEEVSWRLGLALATCGYIILQGCTIIIDGAGASRRAIDVAECHPHEVRREAPAITRMKQAVVAVRKLAAPSIADPRLVREQRWTTT